MLHTGHIGPRGELSLRVIRGVPLMEPGFFGIAKAIKRGLPWFGLDREVLVWRVKNLPNLWRGAWRVLFATALGLPFMCGVLHLRVIRKDGGVIADYGTASLRVVTTVGAGFIVDAFQNIVELENMKFHALGTGGTAEAVGDTALVTELTTQYNPNSTRATGSTTEASATVYRTVGTNTVDATAAITEHGIFDTATAAAGVLLDRSLFSVVNLASGDSLQSTYDFTVNTGG